jgi:heme/copper-type cytochrome/quinol oxidase subunit 2/ferredoxin
MNFVNKLVKRKKFPYSLRVATLVLFIFIMYISYFGLAKVINPNHRIALFVIWTLWWPMLYISLLFFARAWCGFLCPINLANKAGNKIRTGRGINLIKWGFVAYVLFFVIVLLEQISGLFLDYNMTLVFILLFFGTAFVFGMLFSRWSFCRFICPIGTILSLFSRLSMIGLRTDEEKCKICKTKDCMKGGVAEQCPMFNIIPTLKTNKNCLLCTNCIKNCPYDSAQIKLVKPGKEVVDEIEFTRAESFFVIALIGMTFILNSRGTALFRELLFGWDVSGALLRTIDFGLSIGLSILVFVVLCYITTKIVRMNFKDMQKKLGYIYLPLVFGILFFSITFGFLGPYVNLPEGVIALSKYVILFFGILWSIYFAYKLVYEKVEKGKFVGTAVHVVAVVLIGVMWFIYLIPGPLNLYPEIQEIVIAEDGKIIKMEGYSMGFLPNTIIAKKGQELILEINNKDIVHAFDINEFNVHKTLLGGTTTVIKFTPDKTGEFVYYCNIPGHTEAGMKGKLVVEE